MDILTELSLYTGYGGFSLGLRLAGVPTRTVCYVEINPYRQEIIKARIKDGFLDDAPIWDDAQTFDGKPWRGLVDLITAGFPCQPHSTAGRRRGAEDPRNLWPDTIRVIRQVRPRFVLLENVPGITYSKRKQRKAAYVGTVLGELAQEGYDAIWDLVSAAEVGAPHLRWRWWCLAWATDTDGILLRHESGWGRWKGWDGKAQLGDDGPPGTMANSEGHEDDGRKRTDLDEAKASTKGLDTSPRFGSEAMANALSNERSQSRADERMGREWEPTEIIPDAGQGGNQSTRTYWCVEPPVGRVADGVANRVDRLAALGDGIVPGVVAEFLRRICHDPSL